MAKDRKQKDRFILAGDVGGTKTVLALYKQRGGPGKLFASQSFESRTYDRFDDILDEFLDVHRPELLAATFGVAGPVINGNVVTTNLPWKISEKSLAKKLKSKKVTLINDLVANAYGIETMRTNDFVTLNHGKKMPGHAALLSPGTGLGTAFLFWDGTRHVPIASEGGHVDFGPTNSIERDLLVYLAKKYNHVSYERILTGTGLQSIYEFLKQSGDYGRECEWVTAKMEDEDPAAVITSAARLQQCKICEKTLDIFSSICGAAAGNLALLVMATAGVFIGGGIPPKIIWKLKEGAFMNAFTEKGRLSHIVKRIPVKVIMNDRAALQGAAAHALEMSQK